MCLYLLCIRQLQTHSTLRDKKTQVGKWEPFWVRRFLTKVHCTCWCIWSIEASQSFPSLSLRLDWRDIGEAGFPGLLSVLIHVEQSPGWETAYAFSFYVESSSVSYCEARARKPCKPPRLMFASWKVSLGFPIEHMGKLLEDRAWGGAERLPICTKILLPFK